MFNVINKQKCLNNCLTTLNKYCIIDTVRGQRRFALGRKGGKQAVRKEEYMTDKQFNYIHELELIIISLAPTKEEAERLLKEAKEKALRVSE